MEEKQELYLTRLTVVLQELRKRGYPLKSINEVYTSSGVTRQVASNFVSGSRTPTLTHFQMITTKYPEVNCNYLLNGTAPVILPEEFLKTEEPEGEYQKAPPDTLKIMTTYNDDLRNTISVMQKALDDKEKIIRFLEERK